MFTGIIEAKKPVTVLTANDGGIDFWVDIGELFDGCGLGDSIAVNGCCLTVAAMDGTSVEFHAGRETLELTHLGSFEVGSRVNIERSLRFGDQLGGHLVSGHVDGVGEVIAVEPEPSQTVMRIRIPAQLKNQVILKGSVALDGISLTISEHIEDVIAVSLIPHTMAITNLCDKKVGDPMNVESDMIGKWIQRQAMPVVEQLRTLADKAQKGIQND
ncbi:MAG: riboflavin synthase [Planctomycetota bacterium]|jgi:riboflavin synthase